MDEITISPYLLAAIFFLVALAYSSTGLGGGSTYTALLAIFGVSYLLIPSIALILNVLVTAVGSFNFIRKGYGRAGLILPFIVTSMPMAYLGGSLSLRSDVFYWILLVTLIISAARIYLFERISIRLTTGRNQQIAISLLTGSVLGFVAGTVGIGGGIYLVPLILLLGLGTEQEAAATSAVFVLINSVTGLVARTRYHEIDLASIAPLIVAVIIGGIWGSLLGSGRLSSVTLDRILGVIILIAIGILSRRIWG